MNSARKLLYIALLLSAGQLLLTFPALWTPAPINPINPGNSSLQAIQSTGDALFLIALIVFCLAAIRFSSRDGAQNTESEISAKPGYVIGGFAMTAAGLAGLALLINPWGMYPSRIIPPRIENSRALKTALYQSLLVQPQIVVLGSSRYVPIPAAYLGEQTGRTAFNASFFGGRPVDHLTFANLVYSQQAESPPELFLVEVNGLLAGSSSADPISTPASWLGYLSLQDQWNWWGVRAQSLFDVDHLADALYTWRYQHSEQNDALRWQSWEFDATGSGSRAQDENFRAVLVDRISNTQRIECHLPEQASTLTDFITLARKHGTAVVFTSTPYHPAFYEEVLADNLEYEKCQDDLRQFFDLFADYGVRYLNYDELELIHGLETAAGFFDHQHISPANARLLIDASLPAILEALEP